MPVIQDGKAMTAPAAATLTNVTIVTNVIIMLIALIPIASIGTAAMDPHAPTPLNVSKWKSITATSMCNAQIPLVYTLTHVLKALQVLTQVVSTTINV